MKYVLILLFLSFGAKTVFAQNGRPQPISKPVIDSVAVKNWPRLGDDVMISDDGNYFSYVIFNQPSKSRSLFVQSTKDKWKKQVIRGIPVTFSADNKKYFCIVKDTLYTFKLGTDEAPQFEAKVSSWKQPARHNGKWLAWQVNDTANTLVFRNLPAGKKYTFKGIKDYSFDATGNTLLLKNAAGHLIWFDLNKLHAATIWTPGKDTSLLAHALDNNGTQLALVLQNRHQPTQNSIWYYKPGFDRPVLKASYNAPGIDNFHLGPVLRFSDDGNSIFTVLQRPGGPAPKPGYVKLDVWSYTDTILQSSQLTEGAKIDPGTYDAVLDIETGNLIKLCQNQGDYVKLFPEGLSKFILVGNNNQGDRFWLKEEDTNWLVSLKNGQRISLPAQGRIPFSFSRDGNWLVYYDLRVRHYFSYNLVSHRLTNISAALTPGAFERKLQYQHEDNGDTAKLGEISVGIADWLPQSGKILVYDNFDVWQLDLKGTQKPVNLTLGYGQQHNIKFRLFSEVTTDQRPLLTAFNVSTKENGFFRMNLDGKAGPELLVMEPKTYFHSSIEVMNALELDKGLSPLKALRADKWIIKSQSAMQSPNFFITSDFKKYTPLTFLQPEKNYNWLKSELVTWVQPPGLQTQGILYKPENFDSTKKYPVLFLIYEQYSHRLCEFPQPAFSTDLVNIPWFVSQGYLIFMPDIHFFTGEIGASALRTVVSAVKKLSELSYINTSRLAIMGHSYSGQMAYHIVAHSNLFAAAVASGGSSNQLSGSLQLEGYGLEKKGSLMPNAERRLGASLWQGPGIYFAEMPVLLAHKVTTPLLILHSITDGVPWEQAVEMFVALRRNGKRTWMLQYQNSGHSLFGNDAIDYTYRIGQFFDHYLKNAPAPRWMTSGIRAERKGVDTGFQYDEVGSCGKECTICNKKLTAIK